MTVWTSQNLTDHVIKHGQCVADLVGNPKVATDPDLFARESTRTVADAWGVYEADHRESDRTTQIDRYIPAVYYIDNNKLQAITTSDRKRYRTYYHAGCEDNLSLRSHTQWRQRKMKLQDQRRFADQLALKLKAGVYAYRNIRWVVKPSAFGTRYDS